ncbi:MAG TPA: hemolysin family protein [Candidatus Binatia bacterium]|nr:hemolysin family protein [Candidatus Binatia bacterium]
MIPLVLALPVLAALRAAAAIVEMQLATAAPARRRWPASDATLAAAARATSYVAGATMAGIVATVVWAGVGRAWIPMVLVVFVPSGLILCDLVPRGLASDVRGRRGRLLDGMLLAAGVLLAPLLALERGLAALLRRPPGVGLTMLRRLGTWLAARAGRGPLDVSEAGLVARIAGFAAKTARDAMVSHVDVCAVPDTASVTEVVTLVQERGFSRLPVFHERMFNTLGIVSSLDLLGVSEPDRPVTAVMREPLFVPETKPLPELLAMLQAEGRNLALVVDEYGGFVGLVTVEDLVEEIVGEIQDEYDAPREHYRRVAPGVWLVSARAPVSEVNERFGWNVPPGEYETLGGFVLERLGRVPKPGDVLPAGRVRIVVARASARAVQELRIEEGRVARRDVRRPAGPRAT